VAGGAGGAIDARGDFGLKRGIEPGFVVLRFGDAEGGFASGGTALFDGADVERIANEVAAGGVDRGAGERFGIAGNRGASVA